MQITGKNLSVDAIRAFVQEKKDAAAAEARAHAVAAREEQDKLREEFMKRDIQPEAMDRIALAVRRAVEQGEKQVLVLRFPSEWLPDQGRGITSHDDRWVERLDGFAKRALDFFKTELEPKGFQIRAQILDWPGGMPGDVGFFLQWKSPEEM